MNHSNCILENGDLKGLSSLEFGDKIISYDSGKLCLSEMKIYLSKENEEKIFTKITLDNDKVVILSRNHYVLGLDKYINVSDLEIGDKILYLNDKNEFDICQVNEMKDFIDSGCYFILTEKGNIIIDNFVVSSFSNNLNLLNIENLHPKLNLLTVGIRKFPHKYIVFIKDNINKLKVNISVGSIRIRTGLESSFEEILSSTSVFIPKHFKKI